MAEHKMNVLFRGANLKNQLVIKRNAIEEQVAMCMQNPRKWTMKRIDCVLDSNTKKAVRLCQAW
jgi:hypothetical protein